MSAKQNPETGVDAWCRPGRFAVMLGLCLLAAFPRVLTGSAAFFYRDYGVFTGPVARYQHECFWRGELPLWNPLNDCGIPLLAQWNTATLYPPALFHLLLPLPWSLGVFNVAHLFLAGLGMYFLARRWTGSSFAGAVAGLLFAFNGLTWQMLMWVSNLAAFAWMPWLVLLMERARREGGRWIAVAALAGATQMLSGAPEVILLTWLFVGAAWLTEARGSPGREPFIRGYGRLAAVAALVFCLSAAQLLPFLDLLAHSERDSSYSNDSWAMPVSGLANFLAPLVHCFAGPYGVFVQRDQYWVASYYVGAGALLLALTAAWRVRGRRVLLLTGTAVLGVALALGPHGLLYPALKSVFPQIGFMRYPIKFVLLTIFALPLLAGYAVVWLESTSPKSATKYVGALAALLLLLLAAAVFVAGKNPLPGDDWSTAARNAAVRAAFLVLAAGCALAFNHARTARIARGGLLALLLLDSFTQNSGSNPTVESSVYQPGEIRANLKLPPLARPDEPRFMQSFASMEKVRANSLAEPAKDYLCRRLALFDNCNLLDDIPKVDGFYSLHLRECDQALSWLYARDAQGMDTKGLKDFLGVARVSSADPGPGKFLEWDGRATFLPLVTAGQQPVFTANALTNLADFEPRETVFLPLEAKGIVAANRNPGARVRGTKMTAERLEFEVEASTPAMVAVAQSFYHPWRATVDGNLVRLWRANHAFQALEAPAGRHQVVLIYADRWFQTGAAVSLTALAGVVIWLMTWGRRKSSNLD